MVNIFIKLRETQNFQFKEYRLLRQCLRNFKENTEYTTCNKITVKHRILLCIVCIWFSKKKNAILLKIRVSAS